MFRGKRPTLRLWRMRATGAHVQQLVRERKSAGGEPEITGRGRNRYSLRRWGFCSRHLSRGAARRAREMLKRLRKQLGPKARHAHAVAAERERYS